MYDDSVNVVLVIILCILILLVIGMVVFFVIYNTRKPVPVEDKEDKEKTEKIVKEIEKKIYYIPKIIKSRRLHKLDDEPSESEPSLDDYFVSGHEFCGTVADAVLRIKEDEIPSHLSKSFLRDGIVQNCMKKDDGSFDKIPKSINDCIKSANTKDQLSQCVGTDIDFPDFPTHT